MQLPAGYSLHISKQIAKENTSLNFLRNVDQKWIQNLKILKIEKINQKDYSYIDYSHF